VTNKPRARERWVIKLKKTFEIYWIASSLFLACTVDGAAEASGDSGDLELSPWTSFSGIVVAASSASPS